MLRRLQFVAQVYLLAGSVCLMPLYGASKATQEGESGPAQITASSTEANVPSAARQVILNDLPEAEPYYGEPRAMPDQKEPIESDENQATGVPIPGYQLDAPSPAPISVGIDTAGLLTYFAGGTEEKCGFWIPSDHALASDSGSYEVQILNCMRLCV